MTATGSLQNFHLQVTYKKRDTGFKNKKATYMPYTLHYYHGSMVKCVKTNMAIPLLTKYHE